ncbi:hypothetical protein SteCoe_31992 [Stentor coeruleus]|uniref:EF-hand domain-containing protein n=1 Tax=Stentor coeruleus TaxID=5963 RepID=A0A1R2B008_9CILI|nr:hypothetical protein SteCoe_31992 [Stentor coeruleus]
MSIFKNIISEQNESSTPTRVSFGGGYQMPKQSTSNKVLFTPSFEAPTHKTKTLAEPPNPSSKTDLLSSIDKEIFKLRSDSNKVAEFRVKFAADFPTSNLNNLEEIEKLRLLHQEKLKAIEAEYKKHKENSQQQPKSDPLKDYQNYKAAKKPMKNRYENDDIEENIEIPGEKETLLKWIFNKIDTNRSGLIEKHEMLEEICQNQELRKYFGIDENEDMIEEIERLVPADFLSQKDFMRFFLSIRTIGEKQFGDEKNKIGEGDMKKVFRSPKSVVKEYPIVVLNDRQLGYLEKVFQETDIHGDMTIQKFEYLQSLRTDDDVIKILQCNAVEISPNHFVSLEEILDRIQDSEDLYEYITYSQFLNYFYIFFPKKNWLPEEISKKPLLDSLYIQILQDIFDSLPRKTKGMVSTKVFIDNLKDDPQVQEFINIEVRKNENFGQILKKIDKESAAEISWEDFIDYFTEKGKPALKTQESTLVNRGNYYALKDDFSKVEEKKETSPKRQKFKYEFIDSIKEKDKKQKNTMKFTVPEPFDFDAREKQKAKSIRQTKFEQYINEKIQEEDNHIKYRPKANPVPAEVMIPKYNSLLAAQEARRNEVKQNSKKITKDREKPFEFYIREMNKPKPEEIKEEPYVFKAKVPPPSNSIPLYEQMSRKLEEERKSRIEIAAKKALEEAKLPARMERYAKGDKNLSVPPPSQSTFKAKKPPDFTKLWDSFGKSLDKKKQSFQPTVAKEFNFGESKKRSIKDENDIDDELMRKGFNEMMKKKNLNLDPPKDLPKPTKKQQETEESAKKRREEFNKEKEEQLKRKEQEKAREDEEKKRFEDKKAREDEENRKKALEGKERIREMDEKYLEQKKKMLESVGNRPKISSTISSEYSKTNSQPRSLTLIKQKMLARGILAENIIGESDNFINIIAEDLV